MLFKIKGNDILLNEYYHLLTEESTVKTYDEEVFCPPCGKTHEKVSDLQIYCCPAERSLKECLYLMPRIPVNGNFGLLKNYNINTDDKKGKGFYVEMFRIIDSFIISTDSLGLIEKSDIKKNVEQWIKGATGIEKLKVYVLADRMPFERPKFTEGKHNPYQAYYKLNEVWGDTIKSRNHN